MIPTISSFSRKIPISRSLSAKSASCAPGSTVKNEQVRLRVNMILNGEFVREGKVLDRKEIPLRLRKERFIGPADEEQPQSPSDTEEPQSPVPQR